MKKTVGNFTGTVDPPYPCWCEIKDDRGNHIRFDHKDLRDLEYLVSSMRIAAKEMLPERDKEKA